ncbi:MAG: F0F1 ATP synthase subunit A [Bacilli bacterium]|nr:F0F1 ATP synthase subunit A [Bacilli bacterium]
MTLLDSYYENWDMGKFVAHMMDWKISGSLYASLIIMLVVAVIAIIIGIMAKVQDPKKPSKGLLFWGEFVYEKMEKWTNEMMGPGFDYFVGYFLVLSGYLFLAFIWSITGMPSVIDNLFVPLSLAIVMFVLLHFTAIRYQHWSYFKRYTDPIPIFLPINLITMWTPIISTTLRMFGNGLSGFVIVGLVQWALQKASGAIFTAAGQWGEPWLAPIPMGILNLYFALFSGYIQTTVFVSLNAVWFANERPELPMSATSQVLRPDHKAQ